MELVRKEWCWCGCCGRVSLKRRSHTCVWMGRYDTRLRSRVERHQVTHSTISMATVEAVEHRGALMWTAQPVHQVYFHGQCRGGSILLCSGFQSHQMFLRLSYPSEYLCPGHTSSSFHFPLAESHLGLLLPKCCMRTLPRMYFGRSVGTAFHSVC